MERLDELRVLFKNFFNRQQPKRREMKRVFQWRRYLEWKDLTHEEKLSAKRLLLVPVFAFVIIEIINKYFLLIVLFLVGSLIYKKIEKGGIVKK